MKKIALISAIAMSSLLYNTAKAQVKIHVGFNFGPRPVYVQPVPVEYVQSVNYAGDEDYYYLPEVDAYYSIPERCYYYNAGGRWITAAYLPGAYRDFNWRTARRYEVRAPRPYMHHDYYRNRFGGVVFNGRWHERNYDRGYADNNRYNQDQYRRDDRRFDNNNRDNGYNRQYDQNRGQNYNQHTRGQDNRQNQNRDRNMGGGQDRFVQNMPQRNNNSDHRPSRF